MMKHSKTQRLASALVCASALLLTTALSPAVAKVFTFGDSYSDNGNMDVVTAGAQPGGQFWAGRFTNGWTLAERVTFRLTNASPGRSAGLNGIQYPSGTSSIGGVDFAHGGATAITRSTLLTHLSISNQATAFRNQVNARRISVGKSDTAFVWAGLNDYLTYNVTTAGAVTDAVVNNIVGTIAATGIGSVLVLNLPNMGDLPGWISGSKRTTLNGLTSAHNASLSTKLTARQRTTAAKLVLVDINRAMALAHQGLAGGFTVTRPGQNGSASGNCLGDGKVLWDCPDTYLYYDFVHLTRSGHEYLTSVVIDRYNSIQAQSARATTSSTSVSVAVSGQTQRVSLRLAAAQEGYSGVLNLGALGEPPSDDSASLGFGGNVRHSADLGGQLSVFSYGAGFSQSDGLDQSRDDAAGFGADWTAGEWIIGAAAFRSEPGQTAWTETQDFSVRQSLEGASVYAAWVTPDLSLSVLATHAAGEQETKRASAIRGLPFAYGRADLASSSVQIAGSLQESLGALTFKGDAALVFEDTVVAGFQESGTLGLSDTLYDQIAQRGVAGRIGASAAYRFDDAALAVGAHYVARLSGNASVMTAMPVGLAGQSASHIQISYDADHEVADRAAAVWASASWNWNERGAVNFGAAAIATPNGEVQAGVTAGLNYKF
jgi:phospholipase/lecithinase/hemolysin